MCSMMFGSLMYKHVSTSTNPYSSQRILTAVLVLASLCFFIPGHVRDERVTLWCFCIFELCCGVYYPVMASLKGKLVDDGLRASVYGMLRIPLNVFVVLALSTTKEGELNCALAYMRLLLLLTCARREAPRHGVHDMQRTLGRCCGCRPQSSSIRRLAARYTSQGVLILAKVLDSDIEVALSAAHA
jgi:hypothetical protein